MAKPGKPGERVDALLLGSPPAPFEDLDPVSVAAFASERDEILEGASPDSLLPETEEAFYARDPFSADYLELLQERRELRPARTVDQRLRQDLLERPHLMERPEEGAHRGAAAVWRSLRGQLHQSEDDLLDSSDPQELLLLQREVEARRMVVDSVNRGLEMLLKRIKQRIEALPPAPVPSPAPSLADAAGGPPPEAGAAAPATE